MRPSSESTTDSGQRGAKSSSGITLFRILQIRDFRILWFGGFLSFTGAWVQNVAQGHFVYDMTRDESKLAFVTFCASFPVFLFGLVAGSVADIWNKRTALIVCQAILSVCALYLALATHFLFVEYWHIVLVACTTGFVACIEIPTRQSMVSRVVPADQLASAVPVHAMSFNAARILGPALGGILLRFYGVSICYLLNALSYLALIWAATMIRADLKPTTREPQAILDLATEGMRYTLRDVRLRTLFCLEATTAIFGIAYLPMLPAYVAEALMIHDEGAAKQTLGNLYTAVGIGGLVGLLFASQYSSARFKRPIVITAIWLMACGLLALAFTRSVAVAYVVLAVMGMSTIAHFNTTNALFQTLAPIRLHGRVLAMHIWALNGLSPFGVIFFGWLAARITAGDFPSITMPGVQFAMALGGCAMLLAAIYASFARQGLDKLGVVIE